MKALLIIAWILPILWGALNGVAINRKWKKDNFWFHFKSLGGYFVLAVAMLCTAIFQTQDNWDVGALAFIILCAKWLLFNPVVAIWMDKKWWYLGKTSETDKFFEANRFLWIISLITAAAFSIPLTIGLWLSY